MFSLDVLKNYTPYRLSSRLPSGGREWDDEEVERDAAMKGIMSWVRRDIAEAFEGPDYQLLRVALPQSPTCNPKASPVGRALKLDIKAGCD